MNIMCDLQTAIQHENNFRGRGKGWLTARWLFAGPLAKVAERAGERMLTRKRERVRERGRQKG